jgi:hypothetical protein
MTVWLLIFLLADGEQAETAKYWFPSKYECERSRAELSADAVTRGWKGSCMSWEIPEDFRLAAGAPAAADAGQSCDNALVLRRLQELNHRLDGLAKSTGQVEATTRNTDTSVRNLDSAVKRLDGRIHSLRCYR